MIQLKIKEELRLVCVNFLASKLNIIQDTINSNQEALHTESKSSAGDKHETGRAMLQLEMEKAGQQIAVLQQMKLVVEKITSDRLTDVVSLGAVIRTDFANYYMGISIGRVEIENETYFVISPSSPIGQLLLGKFVNDSFIFQGRISKILEVY